MTAPILTPGAKGEWIRLLDRIEASIAQALDETAEQDRALDADATPTGEAAATADRVAGLRAHLDAAGRLAAAVESLLAADEEEAQAWVGLAQRAAARLASPPGCRVL